MRTLLFAGIGALLLGHALAGQAAPTAPARNDMIRLTPAETWGRWCAPCHAPGPGHPGTQALAVKYKGELPADLRKRKDLTPGIIAYFVRHGVSVMPIFRKSEITDPELQALSKYIIAGGGETGGKQP